MYLSDDMESTVVLNCARMAKIGVSLGLMTSRLHSRGNSSRYWKFVTRSPFRFNSVAIRLGRDRYRIVSLQVAAISWKTSSETRVSVMLRNVMFGHWLVNALISLSRTRSVARVTFSAVSAR